MVGGMWRGSEKSVVRKCEASVVDDVGWAMGGKGVSTTSSSG